MVKKRALLSKKISAMQQRNKNKNEEDTDDSAMTTKTELESLKNGNPNNKTKLKRNTKRTKRRTTKWCKMDIGQNHENNNDSTNTSTNETTTNNTANNSANESPVELSDVDNVAFCQPGILFSDVVSGMGKSKANNVQMETESVSSALLIPVSEIENMEELPMEFPLPLPRARPILNLPLVDSDCESQSQNNIDIINSKLNFKRSGLSYAAAAASANNPFLSPRCRNRDLNINANLIGSINKDFIKYEEFTIKNTIAEYEKPVTLRYTLKQQEGYSELTSSSKLSTAKRISEASNKNFPDYADAKSYLEFHANRMARILAEQEGLVDSIAPSIKTPFIPYEPTFTIFPVGSSFSDENYLNKERVALRALTCALFDNLFYDDKVLL